MKKYEELEMALVRFGAEDVIATSSDDPCEPDEMLCENYDSCSCNLQVK